MTVVEGQRVVVPFGRKQVVGVVMECAVRSDLSASGIKAVAQILDDVPPLPAELLKLLKFCSDYYHHPVGMTVLSACQRVCAAVCRLALKQVLTYSLSASGRLLDLDTMPKRKVVQCAS